MSRVREAVCAGCGRGFEARSPRARWCSDRCRKAGPGAGAPRAPILPAAAGGLVDAVRAELAAARRLDTPDGAQALLLAARMCDPGESGSAVAALSRELTAVRAAALRGTASRSDPVDDLRARRDAKRKPA